MPLLFVSNYGGGLAQLVVTGSVSTGMVDRIGVQLPLREIYLSLTNHPGQLSLTIPPFVGAMGTGQRVVISATGSKGRYGVVCR